MKKELTPEQEAKRIRKRVSYGGLSTDMKTILDNKENPIKLLEYFNHYDRKQRYLPTEVMDQFKKDYNGGNK